MKEEVGGGQTNNPLFDGLRPGGVGNQGPERALLLPRRCFFLFFCPTRFLVSCQLYFYFLRFYSPFTAAV